jgi:putative flippase GtrA
MRPPNYVSAMVGLVVRYRRPIKFGLVGVAGATFNSIVLFSLLSFTRLDPVVAGAIATEVAIFFNFTLNDVWTFKGSPYQRPWIERAVRYNMVAASGWAVSVATLAFMIHVAGLRPMIANVFALAASFVVNYATNKRFTFTRLENSSHAVTLEVKPVLATVEEAK